MILQDTTQISLTYQLFRRILRVGVDFDMKNRKAVDVQNIFHKMEQRTLIGI